MTRWVRDASLLVGSMAASAVISAGGVLMILGGPAGDAQPVAAAPVLVDWADPAQAEPVLCVPLPGTEIGRGWTVHNAI